MSYKKRSREFASHLAIGFALLSVAVTNLAAVDDMGAGYDHFYNLE